MKKKHYSGIFLSLLGVAVVASIHLEKNVKIRTSPVRSDNSVVKSNEISSVCQSWLDYGGVLIIEGGVSFQDRDSYQNVFQTSDLNDGIRMEISPNGLVGVIIGNHVTKEYKSVAIGQGVRTGIKRSSFRFQLVVVNDRITSVFDGNQKVSLISGNILCDKGLVGSGFDESRWLYGAATVQFRLEYVAMRIEKDYRSATQIFGQVLILWGVYLVSSFSRRKGTIEDENIL